MPTMKSLSVEDIFNAVDPNTFYAWVEKGRREYHAQVREAKALGLNGKHDAEGNRITRSTERQFIREFVAGEFALYQSQVTADPTAKTLQYKTRDEWLQEGKPSSELEKTAQA